MPDVSVDREVLQLLLTDYFEMRAQSAARIAVLNRNRDKNLAAAQKYVAALRDEEEIQRTQNLGLENRLRDSLACGDDDSFRRALGALFPGR